MSGPGRPRSAGLERTGRRGVAFRQALFRARLRAPERSCDRYPQGLERQWPARIVPRRSNHTQVIEADWGRNRKRTSARHMRVPREQKGR